MSPGCVTVTVRVIPPPVTVTVALRALVPVLADVAFTVTVPLLEPDGGLTVSQLASSVTLHETLAEIENETVPPPCGTGTEVGVTVI